MLQNTFFKSLILCLLAVLFSGIDIKAQQIPLYSQYYFSPFVYNPSYTGASGELTSRLIYRKQWVDFEGSPETRTLTLDGALANERVGLGAYIYNDITDIFERFSGYITYAYHLPLNEDHTISMGIAGGVQDNSIDYERVVVRNQDDPLLTNNRFRSTALDAGAGVNYTWKKLNIGFSIPQIIETELRHLNTKDFSSYSLTRHYLINASYKFHVWENRLTLQPLVMFRTTAGNPFQVDINALIGYKDMAWLGVSYRYDYAMTFSAAFQVHERVQVGYAYDHAINNIKNYSGGTHEIMVGIRFGRKTDPVHRMETDRDVTIAGDVEKRLARQDSIIETLVWGMDSVKGTISEKERLVQEREQEIQQLMAELNRLSEQFTDEETGEPVIQAREVDRRDLEFIEGEEQHNYYLVVGTFSFRSNAVAEYNRLTQQGYNTGIVFERSKGYNYVFIAEPDSMEEGMETLYSLRQKNGQFEDAWIHIMR